MNANKIAVAQAQALEVFVRDDSELGRVAKMDDDQVRVELARLLHWRKFEPGGIFNQAANTEKPLPVRGSGCEPFNNLPAEGRS